MLDQLATHARLHITIGEAWHAAEPNAIEWIARQSVNRGPAVFETEFSVSKKHIGFWLDQAGVLMLSPRN
jgi:hypothetical protein